MATHLCFNPRYYLSYTNLGNLGTYLKNTVIGGLAALILISTPGCSTMTGENGLFTIATSPVRPYQWKNHRVRTTAVTGAYAVGIVAAMSGGSGGGGSDSEPGLQNHTQNRHPPSPGDNGNDNGSGGTGL